MSQIKDIIYDFMREKYDPYNRGYINLYHVMPDSEDMFAYIMLLVGYFYGMIISIFLPSAPHTIFDFINVCMLFYFGFVTIVIIIVILFNIGLYLSNKVEKSAMNYLNAK